MVEENALAYYKGLSQSLGGQFIEQEHIAWFVTGRRSLMRFNGVLRAVASLENLAELCDPILNTFLSNNLPFFWADFPHAATPGVEPFLISKGISLLARDMPAMARSLVNLPAPTLLKEVEITEVQTAHDRAGWLAVLMEGFKEPEESRIDFQLFLDHTQSVPHTLWRHYLARWHGEPCAISTLLCASQAAGIYHVTTLPAYRGRGLGKALTLVAMQTAQQKGYACAVLFATPDGYPLYQKLGFETVLTLDFYGWSGG